MPALVDDGVELAFGLTVPAAGDLLAEEAVEEPAAQAAVFHHLVALVHHEDAFVGVELFLGHGQRGVAEGGAVAHAAVVVVVLGDEVELPPHVLGETCGEAGLAGAGDAVKEHGNTGIGRLGEDHLLDDLTVFFGEFAVEAPGQDFPVVFGPEAFRQRPGADAGQKGEEGPVQVQVFVHEAVFADVVTVVHQFRRFHVEDPQRPGEGVDPFGVAVLGHVEVAQFHEARGGKEDGDDGAHLQVREVEDLPHFLEAHFRGGAFAVGDGHGGLVFFDPAAVEFGENVPHLLAFEHVLAEVRNDVVGVVLIDFGGSTVLGAGSQRPAFLGREQFVVDCRQLVDGEKIGDRAVPVVVLAGADPDGAQHVLDVLAGVIAFEKVHAFTEEALVFDFLDLRGIVESSHKKFLLIDILLPCPAAAAQAAAGGTFCPFTQYTASTRHFFQKKSFFSKNFRFFSKLYDIARFYCGRFPFRMPEKPERFICRRRPLHRDGGRIRP